MGFATGKSVVDNARMHTNQNYVFNIDLKDFFPSIDQARVWKRLQLAPFCFNSKIASIIAGLCSIKSTRTTGSGTLEHCYVLPQGAPTSPLLTNAICDTIDRRLHGIAKRFGLHYSRYADDITFSSMHNVYHLGGEFRNELERIIAEQRFVINPLKTRLSHCSTRQEVTGLTVGQKINVSRKYVKDLRALLHIWEKYGENAAYAAFYPRYNSEKCQMHRGEPTLKNVIAGKLCYLKMVKGENDPVYTKLHNQFLQLTGEYSDVKPQGDINYLLTMTKDQFEDKLGTTIEFATRKSDGKPYGYFSFQGRRFIVAISKNIDVDNLPKDVQISLTRMTVHCETQSESDDSAKKLATTRVGYLLHKPLGYYWGNRDANNDNNMIPDELKRLIANFANANPELQLNDDTRIIGNNNSDDLLSRLVESNFDLSKLP